MSAVINRQGRNYFPRKKVAKPSKREPTRKNAEKNRRQAGARKQSKLPSEQTGHRGQASDQEGLSPPDVCSAFKGMSFCDNEGSHSTHSPTYRRMGARARAKDARARAKKSANEWGESSARLPAVLN